MCGRRVLVITAVAAEAEAVERAGRGYDVVVGGVGPAAAAAAAATALAAAPVPYDAVISAGIGGGFAGAVPVGGVVVADEIVAADLGAETAEGFVPVTDLGFGAVAHRPPPAAARAAAEATGAVLGTVLTVSTVTGSTERAVELLRRHPRAAAEAMEGFGVAEAASRHGVPVLEIRAVSNAVGPRNRAAWRIPAALAALTTAFATLPARTAPHGPRAAATAPSPHSHPRVGRPSDNAPSPPAADTPATDPGSRARTAQPDATAAPPDGEEHP